MQLSHMARKGIAAKVGVGREVRWKIALQEPDLGI
jgi:hypothetical protein